MNYYKDLNCSSTDSIEFITKKYKELALKYHPDRTNVEEAKNLKDKYTFSVKKS